MTVTKELKYVTYNETKSSVSAQLNENRQNRTAMLVVLIMRVSAVVRQTKNSTLSRQNKVDLFF